MARMTTRTKDKKSNQVQYTPPDLIRAVNKYYPLDWDLASKDVSALRWLKGSCGVLFYGPGSSFEENSLESEWGDLLGWLWLNPPFDNISPWYKKCEEESGKGARIVSLVNWETAKWMTTNVPGYADIIALKRRLTFCDVDGDPIKRISEKTGKDYSASNPKSSVLHIWRGPKYGPTRFSLWDHVTDEWTIGKPWMSGTNKECG